MPEGEPPRLEVALGTLSPEAIEPGRAPKRADRAARALVEDLFSAATRTVDWG